MVTKEYAMVLSEVNDILKFSSSDVRSRIPYKFRRFVVKNMDKNHKTTIDLSKSIEEQSISNEAKNLIALIYRDYLVSEAEKQDLIKQELSAKEKHEEQLRELYNPDNMFKDRKTSPPPSLELAVVNNENYIIKLFNYIKSLFKKK